MSDTEEKISIQPDFLLVERPNGFEVELEDQRASLARISSICKEASCQKVLIRGTGTTVKLAIADVFQLGQEIAKLGLKIAVVESHDAANDDVEFLELVVQNRGLPLRFFECETSAKEWLGVC